MKYATWKRCGCAKQGRSHLATNTPCQDSVASLYRCRVNVVALSDGAGSAKLSHIGSKACVSALCESCCRRFEVLWRMSEKEARTALLRSVQQKLREVLPSGYAMGSLASTALVVAVKRNRYIAAHLGDGVIGVYHRGSCGPSVSLLSGPDNGEYSNETTFITSDNAIDRFRIYRGKINDEGRHVTGFILMSDGAEAALYRKRDGQLAPACTKLVEAIRHMNKRGSGLLLRDVLDLISSTKTFDDCSVALMVHV